jgi:hypothetical protein
VASQTLTAWTVLMSKRSKCIRDLQANLNNKSNCHNNINSSRMIMMNSNIKWKMHNKKKSQWHISNKIHPYFTRNASLKTQALASKIGSQSLPIYFRHTIRIWDISLELVFSKFKNDSECMTEYLLMMTQPKHKIKFIWYFHLIIDNSEYYF